MRRSKRASEKADARRRLQHLGLAPAHRRPVHRGPRHRGAAGADRGPGGCVADDEAVKDTIGGLVVMLVAVPAAIVASWVAERVRRGLRTEPPASSSSSATRRAVGG